MYSECELFLSVAFQVIIQLSDCWRFIFLISVFSSTWLSVPWGGGEISFLFLKYFFPRTTKITVWDITYYLLVDSSVVMHTVPIF